MRVAVETRVSLKTVVTWDRGNPVSASMDKLLCEAAEKLGLSDKREAKRGTVES